jgi:acyl-CoA thioesterase
MPKVLPPDDCAPRGYRNPREDSIMQRLHMRLALGQDFAEFDGTPGTGRSALWARLPDDLEMSAATLAILGDYVPFGVGQALGQMAGGNSLDNTLRVSRLVPTEWVLLDIQVHTIQSGFGHGLTSVVGGRDASRGASRASCGSGRLRSKRRSGPRWAARTTALRRAGQRGGR